LYVSPGQACSFNIDHTARLRVREKAKATAGNRFEMKHFDDVQEAGAMPLSIVQWIAEGHARAGFRACTFELRFTPTHFRTLR